MCLSGRFINEGSRACDPVMFQVSPAAAQREPADSADMIMHSELRAGQPLQKNAEPSRCNIEAAGLDPHSICVGNPRSAILDICVDDEVVAVPSAWLDAVCDAAESGDWHCSSPVLAHDGAPHAPAASASHC